jgi:hypothetical protein
LWMQWWTFRFWCHIVSYIYVYSPSESQLITSALKVETKCFSKMFSSTSESTWWFTSKERQNCHCLENLKSHIMKYF